MRIKSGSKLITGNLNISCLSIWSLTDRKEVKRKTCILVITKSKTRLNFEQFQNLSKTKYKNGREFIIQVTESKVLK